MVMNWYHSMQAALATFADPVIFLFWWFCFGYGAAYPETGQEDCHMDYLALRWTSRCFGTGYLLVTAALSMWISNTATAAMMLPLALGLLASGCRKERKTFVFILLGIAYSASIGGLGTIVGSPPNAIAAKALGYDFADWMKVGLPMMFIILPAMLISLYLVLRPKLNHKVNFVTENIPWTTTRIATMVLFLCTAMAWIFSKN